MSGWIVRHTDTSPSEIRWSRVFASGLENLRAIWDGNFEFRTDGLFHITTSFLDLADQVLRVETVGLPPGDAYTEYRVEDFISPTSWVTGANFLGLGSGADYEIRKGSSMSGTLALNIDCSTLDVTIPANIIFQSGTGFNGTFDHMNTAARIWTFPDKSGTVALLDDIDLARRYALLVRLG